jgi:hypothetical protein
VWWPGVGIEPLSYAAGYTEAQSQREPAAHDLPGGAMRYVPSSARTLG